MPEGTVVGTLDEDFAVESNAGDIMLLGNTSWRIRRVEGKTGRVLVEDAHGAPPSIPFWRGEAPARTQELSSHVARVCDREVSDMLPNVVRRIGAVAEDIREVAETIAWLNGGCGLDDSGAKQIDSVHPRRTRRAGRRSHAEAPSSPSASSTKAAACSWSFMRPSAGASTRPGDWRCASASAAAFNFELQAAATDDGLNIALAEQHSFPLGDVFHFLQPETVQEMS